MNIIIELESNGEGFREISRITEKLESVGFVLEDSAAPNRLWMSERATPHD